jgi:membrane-bound lytic murein transglycosylase B
LEDWGIEDLKTFLACAVAGGLLASPAAHERAAREPPPQAPPIQQPPAQEPAAPQPFEEWLAGVRAEARAKGIADATLDRAFAGVQPDPVIIARDRMQPEQTQSLDEYLEARLSRKTLTTAAQKAVEHRTLVRRVQTAYGIPGPVMIAIWGLESNFGQFTGTRPVVTALATLAYDSRRPALFRAELFHALAILDRGIVEPDKFLGSWAGAIGQPQFMPSSFLSHAVDFDRDGRIDIWTTPADVMGSMGNYLKKAGWIEGDRWGREVRISTTVMDRIERAVPLRTTGCRARREMTEVRPLSEWSRLGVRLASGSRLPAAALQAALVRGKARHFLVYRNYDAILDYNCSNAYAVSVGMLSDRIRP